MRWYYTIAGGHTHVRVYKNGKCGDLCFRNEEFEKIKKLHEEMHNNFKLWNANQEPLIEFIDDERPDPFAA